MKKTYILALSVTFALLGCKESQEKTKEESIEIIENHTAEKVLDWDGTYKGFLPCASCPGILTTIKLNNDKTFEKSDLYLESEDGHFSDKGTFSFINDGGKILLNSEKETKIYAVGENRLTLLDKDGKKITSEFEEMYELKKISNEDIKFSNKPIKGFLTFGHEVSEFMPCGSSKTYWISDSSGKLSNLYYNKVGKQITPYTPVIAELIVRNTGKATDGFAEQYESVLETIEIKSVEFITPENYCIK